MPSGCPSWTRKLPREPIMLVHRAKLQIGGHQGRERRAQQTNP
jgi:hypothetical protein